MSLSFRTPYNCEAEGVKVYFVDYVFDELIKENKYIGYVRYPDGSIYGSAWFKDGKNSAGSILWNIKKPVTVFGIGNWLTMTKGDIATVVAISPHESSKFRLVGFVKDPVGRMYPERWTLDGKAGSNSNYDLDQINNHIPE